MGKKTQSHSLYKCNGTEKHPACERHTAPSNATLPPDCADHACHTHRATTDIGDPHHHRRDRCDRCDRLRLELCASVLQKVEVACIHHPSLTRAALVRAFMPRARYVVAMEEWLVRVSLASAARSTEGGTDYSHLLVHIRQQVELWLQYRSTCCKLEHFSKSTHMHVHPLVPFRFPVRPTPRNRESIEEGVLRSYNQFVKDLGILALTTSAHKLESVRVDPESTLFTRLAAVLSLETCRVLDRDASEAEAVAVSIHFIETCRAAVVRAECVALREVREACCLVRDLMTTFCKRARAQKRTATQEDLILACKAWLKTAARQGNGLSHAVHVLCRRRRMSAVFDAHVWLTRQYADFTDSDLLKIWQTLVDSNITLSQAVNWEIRRVEWLCDACATNACWDGLEIAFSNGSLTNGSDDTNGANGANGVSGVNGVNAANTVNSAIGTLASANGTNTANTANAQIPEADASSGEWATGGALVHAPAHMGTFTSPDRLRLVEEIQTAPFSCFLSPVRVTNALLRLLRTRRLVLNKISAEYARRIAAFDFAKYESASDRIVEQTLQPFGEAVGVTYDL